MALDGKVNSDDNAEFRHAKLAAMRDLSQEDAAEAAAVQHNSTTSRWTATSAAWSMALAWRWRRWM